MNPIEPIPERLRMFQVDAFSDRVFSGNPAAVCPLDAWLPHRLMQEIAAENNLSETAFTVPVGESYAIRWFTPTMEVDLCGHATLAAAHVMWNHKGIAGNTIRFVTRSAGAVCVEREGDLLVLDFPSRPPEPCERPPNLAAALGAEPTTVLASRDLLVVFDAEKTVANLQPDFGALAKTGVFAIIATARGDEVDFVSRFFAPLAGIDEDPVTGSAHCTLIPYWAGQLGKTELRARQLSQRGGELYCRMSHDRVRIGGHAVTYLEGEICT